MPVIPHLASGDSLDITDQPPLELRICNALGEHEFFYLQPTATEDKRVYQSVVKHILEFIGTPAKEVTLAILTGPSTVMDLLRLAPVFLETIDPRWPNTMGVVQQGLNYFEETGEYLRVERVGAVVEFKPMPVIGYTMITATIQQN